MVSSVHSHALVSGTIVKPTLVILMDSTAFASMGCQGWLYHCSCHSGEEYCDKGSWHQCVLKMAT